MVYYFHGYQQNQNKRQQMLPCGFAECVLLSRKKQGQIGIQEWEIFKRMMNE